MIKNSRQYRITVAEARRFEEALGELRSSDALTEWADVEVSAVESQLASLRKEIAEYEHLLSGAQRIIEVKTFSELPLGLIRARIASGLSQRDLAERLGLKSQMIQRYEATEFAGASFSRLREVADALGVQISQRIDLGDRDLDREELKRRLREAGVATQLIDRRILPIQATTAGACEASEVAVRVFQLDSETPDEDRLPAAAGFKLPERVSASYLEGYVQYAAYLSHLLIRATPDLRRSENLPTKDTDLRSELLAASDGVVEFSGAVRWLWDHGVAVLPLADPGAFHGAFWRIDNRDVIVLKQANRSPSRWLFDLLHEYSHLMRTSEPGALVIDIDDGSTTAGVEPEEEVRANRFAGDVLLGGDAEGLASEAVGVSAGKLERLKSSLPKVASSHGVNVADLANYMAWRLSMQGENWWGAASNLQPPGADPWLAARDELLSRIDPSHLDATDQSILTRALEEAT